jgi:hypothetical protein
MHLFRSHYAFFLDSLVSYSCKGTQCTAFPPPRCPHITFLSLFRLRFFGLHLSPPAMAHSLCKGEQGTHELNAPPHLLAPTTPIQSRISSTPSETSAGPSTVVLPQSSFLPFVAMFRHPDLRLGRQSVPFFRTSLRAISMKKGKFARSAKAVAKALRIQGQFLLPSQVSPSRIPYLLTSYIHWMISRCLAVLSSRQQLLWLELTLPYYNYLA